VTFFLRGGAGLLERFRDGDRTALEAVYRAYVGSVTNAVSNALRRYDNGGASGRRTGATELLDLVQDVFARAFEPRTRRRFDGVREYGPYLTQIARNVVVDHLRRKQRQISVDIAPITSDLGSRPAPNEPPNDFADFQTLAIVDRYVRALPENLRRVHDALYVQCLSQREAADALGLGRQTIRTLDARLKDGLRAALERVDEGHVPVAVATVDVAAHRKAE